jgi:hypothetical protein
LNKDKSDAQLYFELEANMRLLLTAWPLRAARSAGHALRNAATRFAASADRAVTIQPTDEAGTDPKGDEAAGAKQKSEYLKLFASAGF